MPLLAARSFRVCIGASLFGILSLTSALAQEIQIPKITAEFKAPPPVSSSSNDTGNIGPFTTGPKSIVVDDATRKKLDELAQTYAEVARTNYPLIIKTLHLKPTADPRPVKIVVTYSYNGVAATTGSGFGDSSSNPVIEVSAKYALARPNDLGMIVHEMTHVVQSYPKYDPVWLVEGVADYVRWFNYEPDAKRPHPKADKANARASYQTTAAFLFWVSEKYDKDLVPKINAALGANTYNESLFKDLTTKTLDELNAEWIESLKKS